MFRIPHLDLAGCFYYCGRKLGGEDGGGTERKRKRKRKIHIYEGNSEGTKDGRVDRLVG
jgi:hypothetical protein